NDDPLEVVDLSTPPWEAGEPGQPFEVEGPNIECSTFGIGAMSDAEATNASRAALRDILWRGIAHELWTGKLADAHGFTNKRLAGPDTVVLGEHRSLVRALSLLETAAAAQASREERVVIHAPFGLLPYF